MITYVSKENNLRSGDKIRYIWGLEGPIFILSTKLVKIKSLIYPEISLEICCSQLSITGYK